MRSLYVRVARAKVERGRESALDLAGSVCQGGFVGVASCLGKVEVGFLRVGTSKYKLIQPSLVLKLAKLFFSFFAFWFGCSWQWFHLLYNEREHGMGASLSTNINSG